MITLTWRTKPKIDTTLLQMYINKLETRSQQNSNMFVILLPIEVYDYIVRKGINAKLIVLTGVTEVPTNKVWVQVEKLGKKEEA